MNCINHPDAAVAAYCQNCGKALCTACVRSVSGVIYCEQCLAAKLGISGAATAGYAANQGGYTPVDPNFAASGVVPPIAPGPNPGTATILGFIPGVGAMYNGQYVKALVHVLVFVILIGITDNHGIFGIFIAAWVFYQVFDAHQTAKARREGLPLPDPFGLNELGAKMGFASTPVPFTQTYTAPPVPPAAAGPIYPPGGPAGFAPGTPAGTASGFTDPYQASYQAPYQPYAPYGAVPPAPGYGAGYGAGGVPPVDAPPFAPVTPSDVDPYAPVRRKEPIGAIVLIGLGLLFLFNTLNIFRFDWIGHLWPLIIIGIGAWLLIRRTGGNINLGARFGKHDVPPPPPPAGGGK
jgi:hypothetical protein